MKSEIELDTDGIHLGEWLPISSVWSLIEAQSVHYFRRLAHLFVGDERDLSQSASVALLEWLKANDNPDRIRELTALTLVHRAMVEEVKANRRMSVEDEDYLLSVPDRKQLSPKQIELLTYMRDRASVLAKKPNWETAYLRLALKWDDEQIRNYFKVKKDERHRVTPKEINRRVNAAVKRIREGMDLSVVTEIQMIEFLRFIDGER